MQSFQNSIGNFTTAYASGRQAFPSLERAYASNRARNQATAGTAIRTAT